MRDAGFNLGMELFGDDPSVIESEVLSRLAGMEVELSKFNVVDLIIPPSDESQRGGTKLEGESILLWKQHEEEQDGEKKNGHYM